MLPRQPESELKKVIKICQYSFFSVLIFSMFINLLMLVPPLYMLQLYDRVLTSGSESTLFMLTLLVVLLMVTMGGLEWVRSLILIRVGAKFDSLLNQRIFNASFRNALFSGGANGSQSLTDLNTVRQFLTSNQLVAFFDAPWVPIYITVMFMFHPWYGWMGVFSWVILTILTLLNEYLSSAPLAEANKENVQVNNYLNRSMRNAEVVASMGMLDSIRQRWLKNSNKVTSLQSIASSRAAMVTALSKTVRILSQSLILGIGGYLTLENEITPGLLIAGSILLGRALAPIDMMIGAWKGFVNARTSYQRLQELLKIHPIEQDSMSLPAPEGHISVEGILVVPPGTQTAVIKGITFEIKKGEQIAIIGPSAAGKSTLARALLGIWPVANGKVRLDGADVFSWNREELGSYIGYLPQDIELFDGTISENIARFGELDAKAVVKAAKAAGVHEMILRLPQGYDSVLGGNLGILSGGQRQRIGLARALYGDPVFVVLDEPNSNLDEQGELALKQALAGLKEAGITSVIISHRPGSLMQVDKILVLVEGTISMYDERDAVLAKLVGTQPQNIPANTVAPVAKPTASVVVPGNTASVSALVAPAIPPVS